MTAATGELTQLVKEQINEALRGWLPFTQQERDSLEGLQAMAGAWRSNASFARGLHGPVWMDGASVIDGTITADKLIVNTLEAVTASTGTLNVTGTLTLAASFPATGARVELNSSGIWGYSAGVTTQFKFNTDGSGEIGTGATKMSWTTSGVVTIPVAAIGSLTIAEVGTGNLGGTYSTSGSNPRIQLSTTGITVTNSGGSTTFSLVAATGAMTATGSFTIKSTTTGAHITIDNAGGIAGYLATTESAANRTFLINATDGSGHLGKSTGTPITWDSAGTVTINGSLLVNGTVTAGKISVSNLAAISADLGTITAGTISAGTVNAGTITTGTLSFARVSGGSLGGDVSLGTSDLTISSTGKIFFGTGADDYLGNDILHFEVTSGQSAKIEFVNGSNTPHGTLEANAASTSATTFVYAYGTTNRLAQIQLSGTNADGSTQAMIGAMSTGSVSTDLQLLASSQAYLTIGGNISIEWDSTNRRTLFYGRLYPGTGSATATVNYFLGSTTTIEARLNDTAGTNSFAVKDSAGQIQFSISSNGVFSYPDPDGTAAGAYSGRISIFVAGNQRYLHYYTA